MGDVVYWTFHLVFLVPVIVVLLFLERKSGKSPLPQIVPGFVLIALVAAIYTWPWDNHLIQRGIWSYPPDRVSHFLRIGSVPLEEVCFFLLQPLLTGLGLLYFIRRNQGIDTWLIRRRRSWQPRVVGCAIFLAATIFGILSLVEGERWTYFGFIFTWASPVLLFQWLYGGDDLWRARRVFWPALVAATIYLCIVDRIAIAAKIWNISPRYSCGRNILGLPLEEAVFFTMTNLLVIQGLLLFFQLMSGPRRLSAA